MNLNPLKKDENTDALVKALEDANNVGAPAAAADDPAAPTPQPAVGVEDGAAAPEAPAPENEQPAAENTEQPAATPESEEHQEAEHSDDKPEEETAASESEQPAEGTTDPSSGISFGGNDLPEGLSGDADAHLGSSADSGDLDDVKKSALEQLRPLIETLGLEPADKFDKYLMMLRASDDPTLIKPAYEAAQGIEGEKEKAQALLDIINEINYITANQQQQQ